MSKPINKRLMKVSKYLGLTISTMLLAGCNNQKTAGAETVPHRTQQPRQQNHTPPSLDDIFKMDVNRDGKLTKLEVTGPLLKDFDKIDLNKDGFITREELGEAPKPKRPPQGQQGQRPPRM